MLNVASKPGAEAEESSAYRKSILSIGLPRLDGEVDRSRYVCCVTIDIFPWRHPITFRLQQRYFSEIKCEKWHLIPTSMVLPATTWFLQRLASLLRISQLYDDSERFGRSRILGWN